MTLATPTDIDASAQVTPPLQLVDRAKDLVKSKVLEAAVFGVAHPKWQERPLACVVVKPGEELQKEEVLSFLQDKVAKWWLPDDVVFLEEQDERRQVLEEGAPHPVRGLQAPDGLS